MLTWLTFSESKKLWISCSWVVTLSGITIWLKATFASRFEQSSLKLIFKEFEKSSLFESIDMLLSSSCALVLVSTDSRLILGVLNPLLKIPQP